MGFVIKGNKFPISSRINFTSYDLLLCIMFCFDQIFQGNIDNDVLFPPMVYYLDLQPCNVNRISLQILKVEEGMTPEMYVLSMQ